MIQDLRSDLGKLANPTKAKLLQGFFKTEKGKYGTGDIFIGVTVPDCRKIALKYKNLKLQEIQDLLNSRIHEERLIALVILIDQYKKGDEEDKKKIYNFYLNNTKNINNWDLVDLSARDVVGVYLNDKNKEILLKLAKSNDLWEKRIAIISTYYFIKQKNSEWTFKIAEILLYDKHDLIHKAVGWMLREVGKNISQEVEEQFLKKHYKEMPRTMLRYAIEHFDSEKRLAYLKNKI